MSMQATVAGQRQRESLADDVTRLYSRLNEIAGRLVSISNTLHGPEPRDARVVGANEMAGTSTPNSVRSSINIAHNVISAIESELNNIEQRL